jgi:phosphoenolpyruvate-protein kinase (PTS system EI component)
MRILKGNPVSRGIALGKVYIYKAFKADVHESYFEAGNEDEQFQKFKDSVLIAEKELNEIVEPMRKFYWTRKSKKAFGR